MRCSYQDQRGVEEHGSCPGRRLQLLRMLCLLERTRVTLSCWGWGCYCYSVIMDSLLDQISWDVIITILPYCDPLSVLTQLGCSLHPCSHVGALNHYYRSIILGYDRLWKDQCIRVTFVRPFRRLDWISRETVQGGVVAQQLSLLHSPCVASESVFLSLPFHVDG